MKRLIQIIILLASIYANAQTPKHEVRAVWLTTIGGLDWPKTYAQTALSAERQKKELTDILDSLQRYGFNTVLLQTRIRGTVIYPSAFEPTDACITGHPDRNPTYDPLEFAVEECHKRGMEIQAWVVCMPIGKVANKKKPGKRYVATAHPELVKTYAGELYMNPASEAAHRHIANICREIADHYDVDGIHLDYIRYPDRPESFPDAAEHKAKGNGMSKADWRRDNVTRLVRTVHNAVKGSKPWIKMSCSPIGKFNDLRRFDAHGWCSYKTVFQDVQSWMRDGLMDEIFPMMYFQGNNFYPFAFDWQENSYGKIVVPGLGIYFMHPSEKNWDRSVIEREMNICRKIGAGQAMFRNKFLMDNVKGIADFAKTFYSYPAIQPPMTWAGSKTPDTPASVGICNRGGKWMLTWKQPSDIPDGGLRYNVYSAFGNRVETEMAENILKANITDCETGIDAPLLERTYAVCAVNRYGIESQPAFITIGQKAKTTGSMTFLENRGKEIILPSAKERLVSIADMAGKEIRVQIVKNGKLNTAKLRKGIYRLNEMYKNRPSQTIGFFRVE